MPGRPLVMVTVVLAALAGTGGWFTGQSLAGDDKPVTSTLPSATPITTTTAAPTATATLSTKDLLARAKLATVRLEPEDGSYLGSGTIISASGLVLTNAHVASPQAPGLAFHYRRTFGPAPDHLTVSVNPPNDGPAVVRYRATPLVADGYLDLAVAQIDAMADGSPLPAGKTFPFVPVGAAGKVATGDRLTILGFPFIAGGGSSLSVTEGEVATFIADPLGRVKAPRFEIDTSARIAGGNSGGAAIDDAGELIGVPSAVIISSEYSGRIRPVTLAEPLLVAVAQGKAYVSPYDVVGTGQEAGAPQGFVQDGDPCTSTETELEAGAPLLSGAAKASGMTHGEDVLYELYVDRDADPLDRFATTWTGGATGCLFHQWEAASADGFDPGSYEMVVHVGPLLREITRVPVFLDYIGD
jgi:S1-C subfamily serine protease